MRPPASLAPGSVSLSIYFAAQSSMSTVVSSLNCVPHPCGVRLVLPGLSEHSACPLPLLLLHPSLMCFSSHSCPEAPRVVSCTGACQFLFVAIHAPGWCLVRRDAWGMDAYRCLAGVVPLPRQPQFRTPSVMLLPAHIATDRLGSTQDSCVCRVHCSLLHTDRSLLAFCAPFLCCAAPRHTRRRASSHERNRRLRPSQAVALASP